MTIPYYHEPPKTQEELIERWSEPIRSMAIQESCGPGDIGGLAVEQFKRDLAHIFGSAYLPRPHEKENAALAKLRGKMKPAESPGQQEQFDVIDDYVTRVESIEGDLRLCAHKLDTIANLLLQKGTWPPHVGFLRRISQHLHLIVADLLNHQRAIRYRPV